jgi:hypothetical protein
MIMCGLHAGNRLMQRTGDAAPGDNARNSECLPGDMWAWLPSQDITGVTQI